MMTKEDILELVEKLSELPIKEFQWADVRLVFDVTPVEPSFEPMEDGLEPAEEPTDEEIQFWSAQ